MSEPPAKRCAGCISWKRRTSDSGTCWNPTAPWTGATLSEHDVCERHQPKVIAVPREAAK